MDETEIREKLPKKQILRLEGVRIGLYHGQGAPDDVKDFVEQAFDDQDIDVFVFGHTHYPVNLVEGGKLFFNPGSAFDKRGAPYYSVGILSLANGQCTGKIIRL